MRNLWNRFLRTRSKAKAKPARLTHQLRPFVEQLESRLVPTIVGVTTSSNWSGYAIEQGSNLNAPTTSDVSAVGGTWVVPTVTGTTTGYSADWVGIDGYSSSTVEQIGTEEDVTAGRRGGAATTSYYAWYEMYPSDSVEITKFTVKPGDTMSAEVSYQSTSGKKSSFTLTITDVTENETFTTTQSIATPARSSAEWVVEAPSSGSGVLALDNFGTVNFTGAWATVSGTTGPIDDSAWSAIPIDISTRNSLQDTTSDPPTDSTTAGFKEAAGDSSSAFTVTYDATTSTKPTPPPPPPGRGWGGWWRAVNLPTTTSVNDATAVIAAQSKMTATPATATQPATSVGNSSAAAASTVPAFSAPTISTPTIVVRGGFGDQDNSADNDDTPDSGSDQSTPSQPPAAPSAAPADSASPDSTIQTDGDTQQAVDAIFMAYSDGGSGLISEDAGTPQVAQATALAGFLLALGLRQNQKRSEPEAAKRRRQR